MLSSALISAGGLVAGFGVAEATGSRPLGGVVLVVAGLAAAQLWRGYGRRVMWSLAGVMFGVFVLSHLLGLLIGAWPSVTVVAVIMAAADLRLTAVDREPARSSL